MEIGLHYFKFNIGDYHKKAGRLSMIEHGAYTLLIHACYDREKFPTEDEALDWCWARSDDEVQAVKFVLRKFFDEIEGRFVQTRIQEEIDHYHQVASTNRSIAVKRENERRTKRERVVNEPPPNQEPINQEPVTSKQIKKPNAPRFDPVSYLVDHGVNEQTAIDWVAVRKSKRAAPTKTAIDGISNQAKQAGMTLDQAIKTCCERGWASFQAEWVRGTMRDVLDNSRLQMIENTNRVIREMQNAQPKPNVANNGKTPFALRGVVDAEMGGLGPIDVDV